MPPPLEMMMGGPPPGLIQALMQDMMGDVMGLDDQNDPKDKKPVKK